MYLLVPAGALLVAAHPTDVVTDLKLTTEQVHNQVFYQLTSEDPSINLPDPVRRVGKQLSAGARVSAVRAMGAVVRAYVESPLFRNRYDDWLRGQYRVSDKQTAESAYAENVTMNDVQAAVNQQVTQTKAIFSQLPVAMLAQMLQQQMTQFQQQMSAADAPGKAALARDLMVLRNLQPLANTKPDEFKTNYIAFMSRYMAKQLNHGLEDEPTRLAEHKAKAAEYRNRFAQYRANADPNLPIKRRLCDFIELAESVDFDARVIKQGNTLEFVRDEYSNQSSEWKLLYRIGREPVLAAHDMARLWLNDLK
ncbi:MAG: hypothetical protein JWP57_1220 [Spirosoma sp.]|nr:hypothetical protein [Spirosoma sp.]